MKKKVLVLAVAASLLILFAVIFSCQAANPGLTIEQKLSSLIQKTLAAEKHSIYVLSLMGETMLDPGREGIAVYEAYVNGGLLVIYSGTPDNPTEHYVPLDKIRLFRLQDKVHNGKEWIVLSIYI